MPVLRRPLAQAPAKPAPPPATGTAQQAPQQPSQQAPQQPPSAQTKPPATSTAQGQDQSKDQKTQAKNKPKDAKDQPKDQSADQAKKADTPIPQKDNPDVKSGSKQDVDAIGNRSVGKGVNFYSLEKEIALGKGAAQEIERSAKLVDDPVVTEYVNRVGQNLVRNSDAKVPFTIKVIDSDQINAFALPGGFFYVNSGLILAADSEAEVAGVMSHEIAHVAARHGRTRAPLKGEIAQLATIPLILLGPGGWGGLRHLRRPQLRHPPHLPQVFP